MTVLIVAAGWGGLLRPWREDAWPVLAIAGLLAAGLVTYGIRLMWRMPVVPGAPRFDSSDHQLTLPDGQEEFQARLRETPLTLSPSWDDGALFDATTREAVAGPLPPDMVTQEDWELIAHWLGLIRDVMDPSDPERRGFRVHDGAARMEAEGRPLFERLAARMAPGQLRFEPVPWPRLSRYDVTAVKLMCDAGTDPLWGSRDGFHESMDTHLFGLSWSLPSIWASGGWISTIRWIGTIQAAPRAGLRRRPRRMRLRAAYWPCAWWESWRQRAATMCG